MFKVFSEQFDGFNDAAKFAHGTLNLERLTKEVK